MAAYAALVSLMNIMDNIQNHPRLSTSLDDNQAESLGKKLGFLLDFVESYNSHGGISKEDVEDLESQIASAAHAAEDVIESHVVDQIHAGFTGGDHEETGSSFLPILQKIIEEIDSIKEKVLEVKKERGLKDEKPKPPMLAASSRPLTTAETAMVGFDSNLVQLLDCLTGQQSYRQIIPITGMGGIGKTTLAKNAYEDLLVVQHFDIRAWVTISQEFDVRKILLEILSCLRGSTSGMEAEDELGEKLHKILSGRRYLIVLDDMWSIEAWDKIKFYFPDNCTRSRIIVTTRISNLASHFGSSALALNLLDDGQSWDLFCEKVFGEEDCPPELEVIGEKIVEKCKGLPLSIVVIGGLLRKSSKTKEYWESVAKDLSLILNSAEDNQCLDTLWLSYSHLPACLKPCFLYLGIFPEDYKIHVSRLVKRWVAEGFIKPNRDQSLEEVARAYIMDLIDRNLILVHELGKSGKFKTFTIHDLLRDLCLKVALKEKFFCVMRELDTPQDIDRERRIVIFETLAKEQYEDRQVFNTLKSTSLVRSVIGESRYQFSPTSRLLRVLDNARIVADSNTTFQQVNLRFLNRLPIGINYLAESYNLPSSISLFWNLQTLYIQESYVTIVAPPEIWEMPQLRHLRSSKIFLPDPPRSDERNGTALRNLQSLVKVVNFNCGEEVSKRMPNIKKLHIEYALKEGGDQKRLFTRRPSQDDVLQNLMFPRSLNKLYLEGCQLHWDDLTIIGSLPHLEVLKLYEDAVRGPEWNPIEGEFLCLKFLGIYSCSDLVYWNADQSHFPVLEKLDLDLLLRLDEIPSGIGEIPTLKRIDIYDGSISAGISAMKILEEQGSLGNEDLRVKVGFWADDNVKEFRKIMKKEGFWSHNFKLY